ncbi:DEAD/DEAH box helicase [Dietzia psychralcaliphila]|uniref:DEAD/DEAH box helicase n=1 Tax=Dietzia psychralcaliphila TaxID=139021 RepID=A0AAD0JRY8_9ACTN|nr:DEAD/DEAH box helicase [Dietzia psychralcaliphila]AWH95462.1 DEAD/DEAH box helicase [Dietzia psychralcaliphila]PTM88804.1 ATP-dependent RNA helicase HelY [Dietzia psychralcaliphila]
MTTPSDPHDSGTLLESFLHTEGFDPDPFQLESFTALDAGRNLLVSAPTGSGKTLIGEYAAHRALSGGGRCFYTTPVKALSNQKFRQFRHRFGPENVGLLTGDHSIDADAPVVVMTTEVLRNMIYSGSSALHDLDCVVMDEIHYLGDRSRGVVWEEIILTLDPAVRLVGLSATLSNTEELGDWITEIRGDTAVVLSDHRPVPLAHMLYTDGDLVPIRAAADQRRRNRGGYHDERVAARPRAHWARRQDVIEKLDDEHLLPAIYFVFSRAGCDGAVSQMRRARLRLTTGEESRRIASHVDAACAQVPRHDLDALDFSAFRAGLVSGIAAHHAGMLPLFRTIVEELFSAGLIKVVFATETLALGIHMPARAVVLEKTTKFNGDTHAMLTSAEYSQITGRAGRRGIDTKGTAVVLDQPDLDLDALSALVDTPRFPLRSAFTPDYSMAVNLVEQLGVAEATSLIGRSFAQFQTDRTLVSRSRAVERRMDERDRMRADLEAAGGDSQLDEYMSLRADLTRLERSTEKATRDDRLESVRAAMLKQTAGSVITVGRKRFGMVATVLQVRTDIPADPALLCLTDTGWTGWLRQQDFAAPPVPVGRVDVPRGRRKLDGRAKRALVQRMEGLRGKARGRMKNAGGKPVRKDPRIASARRAVRQHPLHEDPRIDKLARLHERWARAATDVTALTAEVESDSDSLARRFRRIVGLLEHLGYLEERDGAIRATDAGRLLAGVHTEQDLFVAECLRRGVWVGLDPAGLAAVIATVVAHPRSDSAVREPSDETLRAALTETELVAADVAAIEKKHQLPSTPDLDAGLSPVLHHWVSGGALSSILAASWQEGVELTAGDFVRSARLVVDVLAQVGQVAEPELARTARSAVGSLRRGVVLDHMA